MDLREFIQTYFKENAYLIDKSAVKQTENIQEKESVIPPQQKITKRALEDLREIDKKIIDLIDEFIKPAVENDGGDISFVDFDNAQGVLSVQMSGACKGCPSSEVTLKQGMQSLFDKMLPEVKEIVSIS